MSTAGFQGASCLCLAILGASAVRAHEALENTLDNFAEEISEHPEDYLERAERAWLMLEHGMAREPAGQDIDTLLAHDAWNAQGRRLKAYHLYVLGRYQEAEAQMRRNAASPAAYGPEQPRFLAAIALSRRDTLAALKAFRMGWTRFDLEEDYISMVNLYKAAGDLADATLEEGLRKYPESPGVYAVVYKAYMEGGTAARSKRGLAIAGKGQATLWPRSADWKIRYARALVVAGRAAEAESILMKALSFLDEDPRLKPDAPEFARMRREIFSLLDTSKTKR